MARDFKRISRAARARFRRFTWSTSSPGRLGLGHESLRCRPAVLGASCSESRDCGVDQLSRAIGLGPVGLQCRPAVPEDSRPTPMARELNRMSRGTWSRVPEPTVSNSSPGRLKAGSDGPPCRPAVPDDYRLGPRAIGVDKQSRVTRVRVCCPTGSTTCPTRLMPASEAPGCLPAVLSIPASVRGPAGSTSFPWRLRPGSEGPRGRPAVPDDSCLAATACPFNKLSRVTQASV